MVVLIRYGELSLKGQLRKKFENTLVSNIRSVMRVEGFEGRVEREWGRLYVIMSELQREEKEAEEVEKKLAKRLSFVFGVVSTSPAFVCRADMEEIAKRAEELFGERVKDRTFAVRARRSGEHPFTSVDVAKRVGEKLRRAGGIVDLKEPEFEVYVEVRGDRAYLFSDIFRGFGGLPVGTQGRVLAMDSLSAWFAMRRGCDVDCVERCEELLAWACYRKVNFVSFDFEKAIKSDYPAVFCSYAMEELKEVLETLKEREMPVMFPLISEEVYSREEIKKILKSISNYISQG